MKITYPDALPVSRHRDEIGRALLDNQVVIVCGDTGSGKTTQLPKIAIEALRAVAAKSGRKPDPKERPPRIGCTQPRRLAATSVASRVAEEMSVEVGKEVGYQIRFQDRTSKDTLVKFMTDGILLAETQGDPSLKQYGCLIIDEAHERSLNIDFILGYLHRILPKRPELKILISSATLDANTFSEFFSGAPVVSVAGRTFPVEDEYMPAESMREPLSQHVCRAAEYLGQTDHLGDTLVFLPGEREIRECADVLEGRLGKRATILPLYARQAGNEQQQVFKPTPNRRRIILATNVAETSLTIPDIRSVIDTGIARVNRFQPGSGIQRLQIEKISQASANQRRGRCGRVSEGICVRLYEEEDFIARKEYTDPEILRTNLAGVVLQMEHLGLGAPQNFPFLDPPQPGRITQAYRTLEEIGGIRKLTKKDAPETDHRWALTAIGRTLARLPLDPRVGRILIAAKDENCLREGIVIASALTVQDPKERPQDKQAQADQAHAQWKDKRSDFTAWLRLWQAIETAKKSGKGSTNSVRRFAKANYLNFRRTLEWINLHREIRSVLRDLKWKLPNEKDPMPDPEGSYSEGLHKAILAAIPSHIGMHQKQKGKGYKGAKNAEFWIHPASSLKGTSPGWVMAFEVVETARLFARNIATFDPKWFEKVCPHLVSYRHSAAQWNEDQGAVYGEERVTAFGLVLEAGRRVHYGRLRPVEAREIFIWEALVHGRTKHLLPGLAGHRDMRDRIERMEHKLRRRDGLIFPESIFAFYNERVPADCFTVKNFERWVNGIDPGDFVLSIDDCIVPQTQEITDDGFPDELRGPEVNDSRSFPLTYLHGIHEDEQDADGITVEIPIADLGNLPDWYGTWLVPGLLWDKVESLLRTLHKDTRRLLPSIPNVADDFLDEWENYLPQQSLTEALAAYLREHYEILHADFDHDRILPYFHLRYRIHDDRGEILAAGRDLGTLKERLGERLQNRFESLSKSNPFHLDGITEWNFGDLPESIELDRSSTAYPALCDTGYSCGLRVFATAGEAEWHHPCGLASLYQEAFHQIVSDLKTALSQPSSSAPTPKVSQSAAKSASDSDDGFSLASAFGGAAQQKQSPSATAATRDTRSAEFLSMDDLLQLKSIGRDPARHIDDLVGLVVRRAFSDREALARSGIEFESDTDNLRPALFGAAEAICASLRELLASTRKILSNLDAADAVYQDSIEDAREHLNRLLRGGWLAECEPNEIGRITRYVRGLEVRITRMLGAPAGKDSDKMHRAFDQMGRTLADHDPVAADSGDCPCGLAHHSAGAIEHFRKENEIRLTTFAPELR